MRRQINENPAALAALKIIEEIARHGHRACFVGGGVRDMIMGRIPNDMDLATSALSDQLKELFPQCMFVGAKFGVVLIPVRDHIVEVATFREEGAYHDRRRPDLVTFSTLENDAKRRDFTCNALYYDPIADEIIDTVGGVGDIEDGLLRSVGNAVDRFSEDALRVIRAVRFAANLKFEIESETWQAVQMCASLLKEISIERIRDELIKGFSGGHPATFLDLLDTSGILKLFIPEILHLKGCDQPPEFHPEGDVYTHTRLMLSKLPPSPSPELIFAVLLHDIGKPATRTVEDRIRFNGHDKLGAEMAIDITRRLRLSNAQVEQISFMISRHMQFINVPAMKKSTLRRFLSSETIEDELELHRADCLGSHGDLSTYDFAIEKLEECRREEPDGLPKPIITGDDLIAIGLSPGPAFSVILKKLFDAQLEGLITEKTTGLAMARLVAENEQ